MEQSPNNELKHIINLERVCADRSAYTVTASLEECQALAKRFGLISVESLEAKYQIERGQSSREGYHLTGKLQAIVVQRCVVTLKPVREEVEATLDLEVVDKKFEEEDPLDPEEEEDFEYSIQGEIDLGELTAQYLSLSLNPYPRASDIETAEALEKFQDKETPFSVLRRLKP